MARLSARARRAHERDLAAAFAGVLARQTARVAESIRHRAVTAAAEDDEDWWDQEQAVNETEHALRGPIQDAAVASGGAVAAAYGGSYAASPELDRQVAERTRLAAERTAATTKAALGALVDEYDDPDDAADAIADYGSGGGRAGLVGVMEAAAAFGLGGLAALGYLASKDDDGRVSAKTWILSADHDQADECDDNDGTTIPADDDWPDGAPGELHFGCLCEEDYALVDAGDLTASASSTAEASEVSTLAPMPATATTPAPPAAAPEPITAGAIASHSTPTTDEAWDGQAAERALSNDDGAAVYREAYAWVNPAGQPDAKNSYWGPHHMVSEAGEVGAANLQGCRRAIKALNGSRGASGVPAGDRQAVYNHLHAHLKDAGAEDIPTLKASAGPEVVHIPREVMDRVRRYCIKNNITLSMSEAITAAADGGVDVEGGGEWHAVATVEGVAVAGAMGKREFAPGSLSTRALPLPLMLQREASHGSGQPGGAVICGVITDASRDGARILNAGVFDTSEDGAEAERLITAQIMRHVSIDAEVLEYELVMDEGADMLEALFGGGEILERYTEANEIGLTIVPHPAFAGCVITMADVDLPETSYDTLPGAENPDGPLPIAAGAAWAATSAHPPAAWFEDPQFGALTHARVTPEGRVYGHVAPWGTSHVGYASYRPAPKSPSGYSYFLTGRTDVVDPDGTVREVSTGRITLGTTHAEGRASYAQAVSHYDHTGHALADVVCGEDQFGIWFSGALRSGVTDEQVRVFKASDVSGDWRPIRGAHDMIGILTVNAAGFPIPGSLTAAAAQLVPDEGRCRVAIDEEGRELSLVAAGVIRQGPMTAMAEMARRLVALEAIVSPLADLALERVTAGLTA
jgi:hypothetical protein